MARSMGTLIPLGTFDVRERRYIGAENTIVPGELYEAQVSQLRCERSQLTDLATSLGSLLATAQTVDILSVGYSQEWNVITVQYKLKDAEVPTGCTGLLSVIATHLATQGQGTADIRLFCVVSNVTPIIQAPAPSPEEAQRLTTILRSRLNKNLGNIAQGIVDADPVVCGCTLTLVGVFDAIDDYATKRSKKKANRRA